MSLALPGKKVQALIIIVIGIFLAYFISTLNIPSWFKDKNSDNDSAKSLSLEAVSISNIDSDLDTDKDGLKDWQELLWGTEKNNADSDKDGTTDSKEIEAGRDPSIAGPDDRLEKTRGISESSVKSFSASVSSDPNNISNKVSHDLFAKFMALQNSGNLDEDSQAQVINDVITNIDPGSIPPRYSLTDVRVVDTNTASLRAYGNQVAEAVLNLGKTITPNSSNKDSLSQYVKTIESLRAMNTPATLGLNHLQILNNFNATYQMLTLLAEYEKDPIKGLVALKSIQTNNKNSVALFETIASELKNSDIIFDKTEAGNIWNNYI
jgi:hypothetical protein